MLVALGMGAVAACGGPEARLVLEASLHGNPLTDLEITAVPFDPDRILDSLGNAAHRPRPELGDLERELSNFVPPDMDRFADVAAPWRALRDSVAALAESLDGMDRRAPEYAELYERFREQYARLAQRSAERDRAVRELGGAERELAARAREAAEALRAWEEEAYAAYPAVAAGEQLRTGRAKHDFVSDSMGTAHLSLKPGDWWLVARAPVAENPFMEYRWSVGVRLTSWLPVRVPLTERSAVKVFRH